MIVIVGRRCGVVKVIIIIIIIDDRSHALDAVELGHQVSEVVDRAAQPQAGAGRREPRAPTAAPAAVRVRRQGPLLLFLLFAAPYPLTLST